VLIVLGVLASVLLLLVILCTKSVEHFAARVYAVNLLVMRPIQIVRQKP